MGSKAVHFQYSTHERKFLTVFIKGTKKKTPFNPFD